MAIFNSELLVYKRLVESWIIFFFEKWLEKNSKNEMLWMIKDW
jgi:hypothetical protein